MVVVVAAEESVAVAVVGAGVCCCCCGGGGVCSIEIGYGKEGNQGNVMLLRFVDGFSTFGVYKGSVFYIKATERVVTSLYFRRNKL